MARIPDDQELNELIYIHVFERKKPDEELVRRRAEHDWIGFPFRTDFGEFQAFYSGCIERRTFKSWRWKTPDFCDRFKPDFLLVIDRLLDELGLRMAMESSANWTTVEFLASGKSGRAEHQDAARAVCLAALEVFGVVF